jgi:hypothetical protein
VTHVGYVVQPDQKQKQSSVNKMERRGWRGTDIKRRRVEVYMNEGRRRGWSSFSSFKRRFIYALNSTPTVTVDTEASTGVDTLTAGTPWGSGIEACGIAPPPHRPTSTRCGADAIQAALTH